MSKSLKRVSIEAAELKLNINIIELIVETKTAKDAAMALKCEIDQILKSIIFLNQNTEKCILFMTSGGNRVDLLKASTCVGAPLSHANADIIRKQTGFAIGGVSPIGHLNKIKKFIDPRLLEFNIIWAAAGTPRSMFSIDPKKIQMSSGAIICDFTE